MTDTIKLTITYVLMLVAIIFLSPNLEVEGGTVFRVFFTVASLAVIFFSLLFVLCFQSFMKRPAFKNRIWLIVFIPIVVVFYCFVSGFFYIVSSIGHSVVYGFFAGAVTALISFAIGFRIFSGFVVGLSFFIFAGFYSLQLNHVSSVTSSIAIQAVMFAVARTLLFLCVSLSGIIVAIKCFYTIKG